MFYVPYKVPIMKRLFILLIASVMVNNSIAQTAAKYLQQHNAIVNTLLQTQEDHKVAAKTTATTKYRLKAQSIRDNGLNTLIDSVDLRYSGIKGSTYDYNTMLFAFNYPYFTSPMFNYGGTFTKPQVLFDTLQRWLVNPNTLIYDYYQTDYATYDTGNKLTNYKALYADSAFYPNTIHKNTFTTAKNISSAISSKWVGGVADSAFKQYFSYDTGNRLVKDSTYELHLGVWRIASKTIYTYDASKNLVQIDYWANTTDTSFLLPLVKQIKYVNTYDASKRLLTVLDSFYDGTSAMEAYIKDTFAYTGTLAFHTSWKQHQYDPIDGTWNPQFFMSKHLNTSNLPDTVYIRGWDSIANSWVSQTMNIIQYNSNNDPETLKDFEYNFTAFPSTPNFTTTYYYESFTDKTGIEEAACYSDQVLVYPNPSSNTISVVGLNAPDNSTIQCSIFNIRGQLVCAQQMQLARHVDLSIRDLIPGTYYLIIHRADGSVAHRQTILKQ